MLSLSPVRFSAIKRAVLINGECQPRSRKAHELSTQAGELSVEAFSNSADTSTVLVFYEEPRDLSPIYASEQQDVEFANAAGYVDQIAVVIK